MSSESNQDSAESSSESKAYESKAQKLNQTLKHNTTIRILYTSQLHMTKK